jgi:hypothetical protein
MSNSKIFEIGIEWHSIPMTVPLLAPSDVLSGQRVEEPTKMRNQITFRELAERRIITRGLNGAAAWLRSKVGIFPIDIQLQQHDDVYEMIVRVTYRPLPPIPEVVYERQEP